MTTTDDLDDRLARLRGDWPVGSMVDDVMARIGPAAPGRRGRRSRLFAGLAATGLAASLLLAWLVVASQPTTLLAAVQEGLEKARSAHLAITTWDDRGQAHAGELWYLREKGLRAESPGQVLVEDGEHQWAWRTDAVQGESIVLRQRSPGFFETQLPAMFALPDVPGDWKRVRSPEQDRAVDGRPCEGYTVTLPEAGARGLVLAEADGRIREITVERKQDDGSWRRERLIRIDYDVPVPAEKLAIRFPEGARVIDREEAFHGRYPLEKALQRVELGGLILAVHDIRALEDREGFYVVTSVRGTLAFLKEFPPRRRPLNPEVVMLDVAFQPGSNQMEGTKYDRIVLGSATREGVEFSWWLITPRRFYQVKAGRREYLPENDQSSMPGEPGRLDDLEGKARVPLSATYWHEKKRDARGVPQGVSTWVEVPLEGRQEALTIEEVAGRARRDLAVMGVGGAGGLLGVADSPKGAPGSLRPLVRFEAETVSDADFAAAVRRGLEDLRECDEVRDLRPEDMLPPLREGAPK